MSVFHFNSLTGDMFCQIPRERSFRALPLPGHPTTCERGKGRVGAPVAPPRRKAGSRGNRDRPLQGRRGRH